MHKFETLSAVAAPYPFANIDTDRIIRIERCARTPREEHGRWAFEMERYDADGGERTDFVLNRPPFRGAGILVADENFGCGSSRENAVWAVEGMGIRCVIAPSFGEIFFGNCFQNGVLPVRLPPDVVARLLAKLAEATPQAPQRATLTVDLRAQCIATPWGETIPFEVEALRREALLEGLDPIGVTLKRADAIAAFQARQREARPGVWEACRPHPTPPARASAPPCSPSGRCRSSARPTPTMRCSRSAPAIARCTSPGAACRRGPWACRTWASSGWKTCWSTHAASRT
jgi:3-isopropylmalate/(R)-2-methylmalate dehydratase small subunit